MRIGYARTSTVDQIAGLEAQLRDLKAAGVEKIFSEQLSSVNANRPQLEAAIDFAREGDVLIVTRLDRLARSVANMLAIAERLKAKRATLKILDPGLETESATGGLIFTIIGAIAEFERRLMLERQAEGIAKAKREGKYRGRQPTARAKSADALELLRSGATAPEVAKQLGIGLRSVFRIKAAAGA